MIELGSLVSVEELKISQKPLQKFSLTNKFLVREAERLANCSLSRI